MEHGTTTITGRWSTIGAASRCRATCRGFEDADGRLRSGVRGIDQGVVLNFDKLGFLNSGGSGCSSRCSSAQTRWPTHRSVRAVWSTTRRSSALPPRRRHGPSHRGPLLAAVTA